MNLDKPTLYFLAAVLGFLFSFAFWPLFVSWVAYHGYRFLKGKNGTD